MSTIGFVPIRGTREEINATNIVDGQILFETDQSDNSKIYADVGTSRINIGGKNDVDSSLSTTSTNPVQNKVVTESINNINSRLTKSFTGDSYTTILRNITLNLVDGVVTVDLSDIVTEYGVTPKLAIVQPKSTTKTFVSGVDISNNIMTVYMCSANSAGAIVTPTNSVYSTVVVYCLS